MPHNRLAVVALVAATLSSGAAAEPASASPATIEQLTATSEALFAATDWMRAPVSVDVAQVVPDAGFRFGAGAAYLDASMLQVAGSFGASARIEQVLGGNVAQLVQVAQLDAGTLAATPTARDLGSDNLANWSQSGTANFLRLMQAGSGNAATQHQSGTKLASFVEQFGRDNLATIDQSGAEQFAVLYQAGRANAANIAQASPQSIALISQSGNGNVAIVRQ